MTLSRHLLCVLGILLALYAPAQDSISARVSPKYLSIISSTATNLDQKLDRQSQKAVSKLKKEEARINRKLARIDSAKAKQAVLNTQEQYKALESRLERATSQQYIPSLDTITSSLKFLQQNPQLLSKTGDVQKRLTSAMGKVQRLEQQFKKAEEVKKFLKERKQYLKEQLGQLGFTKELKRLNKQVYYYSEQLNAYKELLKDHKKAERKAIELLSKTKLFKDFMRKNSQLASLFRIPGGPGDPTNQASFAGLQTRVQVNNLIQQQLAAGGANARQQFQQNVQQAQSQLHQLKNKVNQFGKGSSDAEMPEGFKPNAQKTKRFLDRLELGMNIQSQKPNGYFPVTSDIGLSLGYKLNDRSVIGIGASYKIGWGQSIRKIDITHQGIGLRSFVDWKIKGSFWLTAGYEINYRNAFNSIEVLKDLNAWQRSALVGVSKILSLKTKLLKQTRVQLLWDFLSYSQTPQTQALLFRIGYSF